jgi:nitroreductase
VQAWVKRSSRLQKAVKENVRKICGAPEKFELMAVFAIGHPAEDGGPGKWTALNKVVFLRK